jgi:prepilin peptidase CpaA
MIAMQLVERLGAGLIENWHVWLVSITLVVAAWIDGTKLKVPNVITFPMIILGWIYSAAASWAVGDGLWAGLGWSLAGTAVGLALLLPAYAIGGMGAGDVKLLAGVGAWVHCTHTFYGFCVSAVIGALLAIAIILYKRATTKHFQQAKLILFEILTIRNPETLAKLAADRKPTMQLLPYGIPIAIGTILYFAWERMLI